MKISATASRLSSTAIANLIIRTSLAWLIISATLLWPGPPALGQEKKPQTTTEASDAYGKGGKKIVTSKEGENGKHIIETKILDPKGVVREVVVETSDANGSTRYVATYDGDGRLLTTLYTAYDFSGKKTFHQEEQDRKSTRLNSSHIQKSRMPSSA